MGGEPTDAGASSEPLDFPRKKVVALLAILASPAGRDRSREDVADQLWGHTGETGARNNLRQSLYMLRRLLPEPPSLVVTPGTLSLDTTHVWVDVTEFESAAASDQLNILEHAASLYAGDFLDGFRPREEPFERWRAAEAERLGQLDPL